MLRAALVRSQDSQTQSKIEIYQTQITVYTRGLKDSGHNQDKLAADISSKRDKEGKFLKDIASSETRREVRKISPETYMYNWPAVDPRSDHHNKQKTQLVRNKG